MEEVILTKLALSLAMLNVSLFHRSLEITGRNGPDVYVVVIVDAGRIIVRVDEDGLLILQNAEVDR